MKITTFPEVNVKYAEDQDEYETLPVWRSQDGIEVTSCWQLSLKERFKLLFTGKLWLRQLVFNSPLQPQLPQVDKPEME